MLAQTCWGDRTTGVFAEMLSPLCSKSKSSDPHLQLFESINQGSSQEKIDNVTKADRMVSPNRRSWSPLPSTAAGMNVLRHLYSALDSAMELVETSGGTRRDFTKAIDFYDEVRRFEISLIEQALRHADGSQIRAAALLGLKHTTLNAKIKSYSIDRNGLIRSKELSRSLRVANE